MEHQSLWYFTKPRVWTCILFFILGGFSVNGYNWGFSLLGGLTLSLLFFLAVPLADYTLYLYREKNRLFADAKAKKEQFENELFENRPNEED